MKKSLLIKKANSRHISGARRLLYIFVALATSALLYFAIPAVLSGTATILLYPFNSVRLWLAESGTSFPRYIRERSTLDAELEALKVTLATEQGTESTIQKLQIENEELRRLSGAIPESRVLARVIGRPGTLPYDVVMLDRGSVHGVIEQAPVYLGADQVIGFVSKVTAKSSLVTLVTTAGFKSTAYVFGPNIFTFAEGMGGGVLRVSVPQGILLRTGDLVLLPAIDSGVYGTISYIETSATQPEQYGYVTPSVPLQSLYYVSVGKEAVVPQSFTEAELLVENMRTTLFTVDVPLDRLVTPETNLATSSPASNTPPQLQASATTPAI